MRYKKDGGRVSFHDDCSGKYKKFEIEFEEPVDIRDLFVAILDKIEVDFDVKEEKNDKSNN